MTDRTNSSVVVNRAVAQYHSVFAVSVRVGDMYEKMEGGLEKGEKPHTRTDTRVAGGRSVAVAASPCTQGDQWRERFSRFSFNSVSLVSLTVSGLSVFSIFLIKTVVDVECNNVTLTYINNTLIPGGQI